MHKVCQKSTQSSLSQSQGHLNCIPFQFTQPNNLIDGKSINTPEQDTLVMDAVLIGNNNAGGKVPNEPLPNGIYNVTAQRLRRTQNHCMKFVVYDGA